MTVISKDVDSSTGARWVIREYDDAKGPFKGNDYLAVQLAGGSYQSTRARPLWIVNTTIAPFPVGTMLPGMIGAQAMPYIAIEFGRIMGQLARATPCPMGLLDYAPHSINASHAKTETFGIDASATLTDGGGGISYSKSASMTISDLEIVVQSYNGVAHGGTGVQWHAAFTRKDGMNVSSFAPRFDALFSFPKGYYGKIPLLLFEELIYWGDYADAAMEIPNTAAIGAASGAVAAAAVSGGLLAPFGAIGGAIIGALGGIPGGQKNSMLNEATHGDLGKLLALVQQASLAGNVVRSANILLLDTGKRTIEPVVSGGPSASTRGE